jgi:2-C-methyl-D-erythritol 4-phosphate cytidylyltransferase
MISALIVAAGQGVRMGAAQRKQYLQLGDLPILAHTILAFARCTSINQIVLVVPKEEVAYCREIILSAISLATHVRLVPGGKRRQDSVYNGLSVLSDDDDIVLIHDGVRPFVSTELIESCIQGAQKWGACIPTIEITDTLKKIAADHTIQATIPRDQLHQAQTPQAFKLHLIKKAHRLSREKKWRVTDDASLLEHVGVPVHVIPGTSDNIKITTPADLKKAQMILNSMSSPNVA